MSWSSDWQPILNVKSNLSKAKPHPSSLSSSTLSTISPVLGTPHKHNLNFKSHIQDIATKAEQTASLIFRCFIQNTDTCLWKHTWPKIVQVKYDIYSNLFSLYCSINYCDWGRPTFLQTTSSWNGGSIVRAETIVYLTESIDFHFNECYKFSNNSTH